MGKVLMTTGHILCSAAIDAGLVFGSPMQTLTLVTVVVTGAVLKVLCDENESDTSDKNHNDEKPDSKVRILKLGD